MVIQGLGLLVLSLIVGSMFGTWRGYDPSAYSASAFLEIHQGSVRGLNVLLPAMGLTAILLTAAVAILMRDRPALLGIYVAAAVLMIIAGLVTRFGNQPINELVMGWTAESMPADWTSLRDSWWSSHLIRLGASFAAEVLLIVAIFADRVATA
jgi:hypothetical protein